MMMSKGDQQMPEDIVDVPYIFFDFNAYTPSRSQMTDLTVTPVTTPPTSGDAGVEVRVLENRDTFDVLDQVLTRSHRPEHVTCMLADYESLLRCAAANPNARIDELTADLRRRTQI